MDAGEVVIAVSERDAPHAATAGAMLMMDWRGLTVDVRGSEVAIAGGRGAAWSASVWATALLNERLVAEAARRRAAILGELVA